MKPKMHLVAERRSRSSAPPSDRKLKRWQAAVALDAFAIVVFVALAFCGAPRAWAGVQFDLRPNSESHTTQALEPAAQAGTTQDAMPPLKSDAKRDYGAATLQAQARAHDAELIRLMSNEGCLIDGNSDCSKSTVLAEQGDFHASIEAASLTLNVAQQNNNSELMALARRDLAIAYSYAGDLDDARRYATEALEGGESLPAQALAPAHKVLGDISARQGDSRGAIREYKTAVATASERYRPIVLLSMTNAQIAAGDAAAARATLDSSGAARNPGLASLYLRIDGSLLLVEQKPQAALEAFCSIVSRIGQGDSSYQKLWAYEGMGRAWLALGDRTRARAAWLQAIRYSEAIRARFRSDEFKTGLFADTQNVFEETIALVAEQGDYELAWALSEKSRSRALLDVVRNRVAGGVDTQQLNGSTPSLDEVRRALRPNEAIVEFHLLAQEMIVWIVRQDGLKGKTLPITRRDMTLAVGDFRNAIIRGRPQALTYGAKLDTLFIKPLDLRSGERLIIVPHGALHYLPFQALSNERGFLIQRHPIAIEPSASIAIQLLHRQQRVAGDLVAFGNPRIAPEFELPVTEDEVLGIAPLFTKSKTFIESQATRRAFIENAPNSRILHVALHMQADTIDPLRSRMLLAPALQPADGPDSLLAQDVYNLKLGSVALVTLSACESALGRIERGDEIMGFTRAFFYAGVSAMTVSMWPVADESTLITMRTFYGALASGQEAIDAMRSAQLAVLADGRFAHPFYWAPFDLIGGWRLTIAQ